MHFILKYYPDEPFKIIEYFKAQNDCIKKHHRILGEYPALKEHNIKDFIDGRYPFNHLTYNEFLVYVNFSKVVNFYNNTSIPTPDFILHEIQEIKNFLLKEKINIIL